MLAPLIGAALVIRFGGIDAGGIRPLFFVSLAGTVGTFFLIYFFLPNRRWSSGTSSLGLIRDLRIVFKSGNRLGRWLVIDAIGYLPMGMVIPFAQPFAHSQKGASELVLGLMITAFALTPLILGLPIGRIADRIGRKPVLYVAISLSWLSSVALILAPNPAILILSGVLLGFFTISSVTSGAMAYELVPKAHMGRWLGLSRLVRMLLVAVAAYVAGWMWDQIGPQFVFLTAIALDIAIRTPLLISMPETLHLAEPLDPSA
jgi:MFS family permease